jgi:hypothetical protein
MLQHDQNNWTVHLTWNSACQNFNFMSLDIFLAKWFMVMLLTLKELAFLFFQLQMVLMDFQI